MEVFLTSPWLPPEWIKAHGLEPRGVWSVGNLACNVPVLSAGVCAFSEAVVRFAEAGHAVIFASTCDQLRRGFDQSSVGFQPATDPRANVSEHLTFPRNTPTSRHNNQTFLFDIPVTRTPAAKELYRGELIRLGKFLCDLGGSAPTAEMLRCEMVRSDAARTSLRECAHFSSAQQFAQSTARFHLDGSLVLPEKRVPDNTVPLAIVGGPFYSKHVRLLQVIDQAGGRIAVDATETGERSLTPVFDFKANRDPFEILVDGYFDNVVDAFQRPNTRLYSWLQERLESRSVRGILLWQFTGCDLWRAEMQTLRERFKLPVLLLEADEAQACAPRDLSRIEAFIETLK